jgi:hypothetical protein
VTAAKARLAWLLLLLCIGRRAGLFSCCISIRYRILHQPLLKFSAAVGCVMLTSAEPHAESARTVHKGAQLLEACCHTH